jgi:hypothetical protein
MAVAWMFDPPHFVASLSLATMMADDTVSMSVHWVYFPPYISMQPPSPFPAMAAIG